MREPSDDAAAMCFSTAAFRPREATDAWREMFGRTVLRLDLDPLTDRFEAEATALKWPGFGVIAAATSPVRQGNSRELMAADEQSHGWVSFLTGPASSWTATQVGREASLSPGDGVLMSNSELGSMTFPNETRFTTFALPAAVLKPLVPDLEAWFARPIPAAAPALRLLTGYLQLAWNPELPRNVQLRGTFATHVADLLALTLGAGREAAEMARMRGARAARLHAVRQEVERRLGEADLSVSSVAARHKISPRYLQQLFEESGDTFTRFVAERRLQKAYRLLVDPTRPDALVSSIAYDCGFADISHFNRVFRQRFGCTPRDVRAAARHSGNGRSDVPRAGASRDPRRRAGAPHGSPARFGSKPPDDPA